MEKFLCSLLVISLILAGCSTPPEEVTTTKSDNGLVTAENIQRSLTASDIEGVSRYDFAISDNLIDGIDTYKLGSNLSITANDNQIYSLYYSDTADYNIEDLTSTDFVTYHSEDANKGFYILVAENNIDATVSITE